jgi:uncharacterized membrane protein (DUF2068 family)
MAEGANKPKEVLKKAPTLYAITVFKLVKGLICLALAVWIYRHSDRDLPAEYQNFMEWMHTHWVKLNPERQFWTDLAKAVEDLTETRVRHFAIGTFLYSLFSLIEGFGLMFRVKWAGWMTIGESAFFIPIEIHHLIHNPSKFVFAILVANIIIVCYLFRNRERLFRHHNFRLHPD